MLKDKWDGFKKKNWAYFASYTAAFIILSAIIFFRFVLYHKTIIWYQDGVKQHYNVILYYGKYLRQIFSVLVNEHRFELPMWDFSIGLGSDVITTFHYYAIGDPLALLSALVPERFCQYFFFFLYLLRLYLAGLAFSAFSFYHGNGRFSTLTGSFIYVFSAYALVLGLMHPFFVAPMVWFPLILLGIDKIYGGKNPALFIISTSIAAMSNFYFFYMEIVLAVLYAVYRYFAINKGFRAKSFFLTLAKFALFGLNAFLISAVILLPVLSVMFSSARFEASKDTSVGIFYEGDYYIRFIADFTNMQIPGSWTLMGYTVVGLLSVVLLFIGWKNYRRLALVFILLTIFALFPFAAFALNGFAYVVNRWMFAYALCVGFIAGKVLPDIKRLSAGDRKKLVLALLAVAVASVVFSSSRTEQTFASVAMILFTALMISLSGERQIRGLYTRSFILLALTIGLAANSYYKMSINSSEWLDQFLDSHLADKKLTEENSDALLNETGDGDFYRIAESGLDTMQNSSIQRGVNTTGFYFSLTNPYISKFINMLYINVPKDYDYSGMDSRSILEALAGVRYYLTKEGSDDAVPFDFDKKAAEGETAQGIVSVYESDVAMPLGYTYDKYVSESDFENMSVTERTAAMLEGAVVAQSGLEKAQISDNTVDLLEEAETKGNCEMDVNHIYVGQKASLNLRLKKEKASELYLVVKNLKFKGILERDSYDDGQWAGLSEFEKAHVYDEDKFGHKPTTSSMQISAGDVSRILEVYSPGADFYCGRSEFLVNLGYFEETPEELSISFRNPGFYSFDSMKVLAMPVEGVSEKLSELKKEALENVKISHNNIKADISISSDKLLVFSIPYSEGWSAYVDGEKKELMEANVMYMGLELDKGDHDIELRYETPYLRKGACLTVVGIIMFFVIELCVIIKGKRGSDFSRRA